MAKAKLRINNNRMDWPPPESDALSLIRGSEAARGGPRDLALVLVHSRQGSQEGNATVMYLSADELRDLSRAATELADELDAS
jgi:hypothetical protein